MLWSHSWGAAKWGIDKAFSWPLEEQSVFFFIIPNVRDILPHTLVVCAFHVRFESIVIPRKSNCLTCFNFMLLMSKFSLGLGVLRSSLLSKIIYLVFDTLRDNLFADSQLYTLSSSLLIVWTSILLFDVNGVKELNKLVSSANSTAFRSSVERGKSLT